MHKYERTVTVTQQTNYTCTVDAECKNYAYFLIDTHTGNWWSGLASCYLHLPKVFPHCEEG